MDNELNLFKNDESNENEKTFTVKEVAYFLGVHQDTVRNWVKKYFPQKMQNGKTTKLNELEITAIKQEMQKNNYLRNASEVTTDLEETLQIMKGYELLIQKVKKQEQELKKSRQKIENDKPKVEFYDNVSKSENLISIQQMGQLLGIGQNRLFKFFYENNILINRSTPYQKYINAGYFVTREKSYERNGHKFIDVRVWITGKGQQYIQKIWRNKNEKN